MRINSMGANLSSAHCHFPGQEWSTERRVGDDFLFLVHRVSKGSSEENHKEGANSDHNVLLGGNLINEEELSLVVSLSDAVFVKAVLLHPFDVSLGIEFSFKVGNDSSVLINFEFLCGCGTIGVCKVE